jgi:hypothetical protein
MNRKQRRAQESRYRCTERKLLKELAKMNKADLPDSEREFLHGLSSVPEDFNTLVIDSIHNSPGSLEQQYLAEAAIRSNYIRKDEDIEAWTRRIADSVSYLDPIYHSSKQAR